MSTKRFPLQSLGFPLALSLIAIVNLSEAPADDTNTQPVQPLVVGFDRFYSHREKLIEFKDVAAGDVLLSDLNCTACHKISAPRLNPKMGPRLNGVAQRLREAWLRSFLASPDKSKPGTTMPDVLHGLDATEKKEAIDALVAFLSTQDEPFPVLKSTASFPIAFEFWNKGDRAHGQKLYHQIGCVACHEPDAKYAVAGAQTQLEKMLSQLSTEEIKELGLTDAARPVNSVPLPALDEKYTSKGLAHFILNPAIVRPHGRMPSLKLVPKEAADIAGYLQGRGVASNQPLISIQANSATRMKLIKRGRKMFQELKCANCHQTKEPLIASKSKPLLGCDTSAKLSCLQNAAKHSPAFNLSTKQIQALKNSIAYQRFLSTADIAFNPVQEAKAQVELKLLQFNCLACHERNGQGGVGIKRRKFLETVGHVDFGDEGRIPPSLTQVGFRLRTNWLKTVFSGKGDIRPYLTARMPRFPDSALVGLPDYLAIADRGKFDAKPTVPREFANADKLAKDGRKLFNIGCIQCHPIRGERLPGVIGVDVAGLSTRVNPDWFREFLLDPGQLKKGTRMPTFFPNGRSSNPGILRGNIDQQVAAIWGYVNSTKLPLPEKILTGKAHDFELKPKKRPIVLRTFMKQAGPHAIAVGFPAGIHFAFDGEKVRLSQLWHGRFLDAHSTWFNRFVPPTEPLGQVFAQFPAIPQFARLKSDDATWPTNSASESTSRLRGYRIDKQGVPTILYQAGQLRIQDRLEAIQTIEARKPVAEMKRTIQIIIGDSNQSQLKNWILVAAGKSIQRGKQTGTWIIDDDYQVRVDGQLPVQVRMAKKDLQILSVGLDPKTKTVELHYQPQK